MERKEKRRGKGEERKKREERRKGRRGEKERKPRPDPVKSPPNLKDGGRPPYLRAYTPGCLCAAHLDGSSTSGEVQPAFAETWSGPSLGKAR